MLPGMSWKHEEPSNERMVQDTGNEEENESLITRLGENPVVKVMTWIKLQIVHIAYCFIVEGLIGVAVLQYKNNSRTQGPKVA